MMDVVLTMMDSVLKMMDFVLTMMDFVLKMMDSVLTMMDSVLKMMDCVRNEAPQIGVARYLSAPPVRLFIYTQNDSFILTK